MCNALRAVRYLMTFLREKSTLIWKTQRTVHLGQGLASLPDDILSIVFTMVYEGESLRPTDDLFRWKRSFRLASVCRRFRHISLQTPQLWTSISTSMCRPGIVSTCLRNGGICDLFISVHPIAGLAKEAEIDAEAEFIQETIERQHRWARFAILIPYPTSRVRLEPMKLMLRAITLLPKLRVLSYADPCNQYLLEDIMIEHPLNVITKAAPNLSSLCLTMVTLRIPPLLMTAAQFLTKLELTGSRIPSDMDGFISSISSLHAVAHLKFHLYQNSQQRDITDNAPTKLLTTVHSFPSVKHLQLGLSSEVTYILSYISFPNVASMELALDGVQAALVMLEAPKQYNHLTSLRLDVQKTRDTKVYSTTWYYSYPPPPLRNFSLLAASCPILDRFSFSAFWSPSQVTLLAPLRTLTIFQPLESIDWLKNYAVRLQARGAWDTFERLHIRMLDGSNGDDYIRRLQEEFGSKLFLEWQ